MTEVLERTQKLVLTDSRMGLAEYRQQRWVVDAAEGTTIERVLEADYWQHVSGSMHVQQFDRIEVRQETGEWIVELIVLAAGSNWTRVFLAAKYDLAGAVAEVPAAAIRHVVAFKGPHKKHCVIRLSDSALIQEGFSTKVEADAWLVNHERVTL